MPRKPRPDFDWHNTTLGRLIARSGVNFATLARALDIPRRTLYTALSAAVFSHEMAEDILTVLNASGVPATRRTFRGFTISPPVPPRQLYHLFDGRILRAQGRNAPPQRERAIKLQILQCQLTQEENMQPLSPEARKHFGLNFDPLTDEVRSSEDMFWTREHRAVVDAMLNAARRQSFLAIIGEVGSGKTLCKMEFRENLPENVRIVEPMYPDKAAITPNNLLDAIILDLAGNDKVSIPSRREQKARRVRDILEAAEKEGSSIVLVLDEAHSYNRETIRALKRLHEMERGFARLLGIVLIGQLELLPKLNDPTLREVHQRCAQVIMHGLGTNTGDYLEHKFARAGAKAGKLITPEAIVAIEKLCRHKLDGTRWFGPYPLGVNVITKAALNLAARTGEKIVTPEIIDRAWGAARMGDKS